MIIKCVHFKLPTPILFLALCAALGGGLRPRPCFTEGGWVTWVYITVLSESREWVVGEKRKLEQLREMYV